MGYQTVNFDELDPADTFHIVCPHCEDHSFMIYVETIQLAKGVLIQCPECQRTVHIYVNPLNILCVE